MSSRAGHGRSQALDPECGGCEAQDGEGCEVWNQSEVWTRPCCGLCSLEPGRQNVVQPRTSGQVAWSGTRDQRLHSLEPEEGGGDPRNRKTTVESLPR